MSQSLTKNIMHIVFSTKDRAPYLTEEIRPSLHSYINGITTKLASPLITIGSVEDHIHLLIQLSKNISLAKFVENVKTGSSKWLKTRGSEFLFFYWQSGYAAFSVSTSNIGIVKKYIENQRAHHKTRSFDEELLILLDKNLVLFDKKYILS
jgi:putative transposase